MRKSRITTKRALGLVTAAALAFSATVATAGSSEAAVAALKLGTATGADAGGTIVTIAGKDFQTAAGTSKVGTIFFSTATCAIANIAVNAVTIKSVASATKVVITTPALALTASKPTVYNLCMTNTALDEIIGTAKFTSYDVPLINDQTPATKGVSVLTGASYGGGTIVITGENFTKKTTAKIGNLPLTNVKVVLGTGTAQTATGGDDTITGKIPPGTGVNKDVSVVSEAGTYKALTATQQFSYLDALKISPNYGDGTAGNVISITGTGFKARSFQSVALSATGQSVIVLNKTLPVYATGGAYASAVGAGGVLCTNIQVESDTQLTCQIPILAPATAAGGYTVQIADGGATNISAVTAVSQSATYTVAAF